MSISPNSDRTRCYFYGVRVWPIKWRIQFCLPGGQPSATVAFGGVTSTKMTRQQFSSTIYIITVKQSR